MFKFLTKRSGRKADGARHTSRGTQRKLARPQLESLEDRLLMSAAPPIGAISLSPTGVLSMATYNTPGAQEVDASVSIVTLHSVIRPGLVFSWQVVQASLVPTSGESLPIVIDYNLTSVKDIVFYGYDASNHFTNATSINSQAYAYGTFNSFAGGTGHDTFYGSNVGQNYFYNSPNGIDNDYGGGGYSYNTFDVYFKRIRVGVGSIYETLTFVHNFNAGHDFLGNPYDVIHDFYIN